MTQTAERLLPDLTFLYGAATAPELLKQIEATVAACQPRLRSADLAQGRARLTERDALLITYADQVHEPGVRPLASLAGFAERHLRGVVSGVHILPFYPSSSDDGFAVKDYFAVDPALGGWDDLHQLHRSFELMFDAVFNHMSAQSEWFQLYLRDEPKFRDFFVSISGEPNLADVIRPRALPLLTEFASATGPRKVWTTFSADQVDLEFRNPSVLLAMLEVMLFYVEKGARFIRLDAIAFLWKQIGTACLHLPQTHRIIQCLRTVLDLAAPNVLLVTETNVPHLDNISYFGDGRNEAQLVYNFALPPLVLHSLATSNAEPLTRWAQTLTSPSDEASFFNFLASHDGVGLNPVRGILTPGEVQALVNRTLAHGGFISEKALPDGSRAAYEMNINYFDALSNPAAGEPLPVQVARFLCAHGIMLSLPGVPGLYFHSLFGSRGDRAGAEASGIARRINREKLGRDRLETELADPTSRRAQVFNGLKRMLEVRRAQSAFAPAGGFEVLPFDQRVFAILRTGPDSAQDVLCLHNVSGNPVTLTPQWGGHSAADWRPLLSACTTPEGGPALESMVLAPYEVKWLRRRY